ncbi:MAG: cysteine hydrolase, partial [Spongiibacteraceae bacterium]
LDKGQKTALLISEMQTGIVDVEHSDSGVAQQINARDVLRKLAAFAEVCRAHDVPVIHCTIVPMKDFKGFPVNSALAAMLKKGGVIHAGNPLSGIHPLLKPHEDDIVCERCHGMSAFHGTELESILRGLGVETVLLAGVSTNIALPGIATEATNRGFEAVLVEDCTAGGTAESHQSQITLHLPLLTTISSAANVKAALDSRA